MNNGMEDPVLIAVIGAVIGLLIGYFLGRRSAPSSVQTRELEEQLSDATASRERFEQRVNDHFAETAGKLNALTENYREVYEHIASGAAELSPQAGAAAFTALAAPADEDKAIEADEVMVEAPRDYAPKTSPDDPGVLNERFGLDGEDVPPTAEAERKDD